MKTEYRPPPRPTGLQEDFACPVWTEAIEAIAQQSATWPWQQRLGRHENDRTVPFAGRPQ